MNDVRRPRILAIDDEEQVRASFRRFLEDRDYLVIEAENGRTGLEVFQIDRPDLVLVDLRMPEIDGLEVLAKVRALSPETPLIVVSGTGRIGDVIEALRLGAWDYVLKPVEDLNVLQHAVEVALERARLLRENRAYQQRLEALVVERTFALQDTADALRVSEEKYRALVESSPDVIFSLDREGRCLFINEAGSRRLGLATVYGIVQQHEGLIRVDRTAGRGSSFHIYLPSVEAKATTAAETPSEQGVEPGRGEMILLAEDDALVRSLVTAILQMGGYAVMVARDGQEAIDLFQRHSNEIALVVVDVAMPKASGRAVYDAVQSSRPSLPFLFTTSHSFNVLGLAPEGGTEVACQSLAKPFRPAELLAKVQLLLGRAR